MRSPLRSRKSRTQPTLSAGSPFSIRLSAIAGCQLGRPLKSRMRAQTLAAGALTTLEV
jgi:hypothetical protein